MAQSSGLIQSVTNINELNDHVLRVAFAHLNVIDLLAVADVSMRFRQNAQAVVSTRYKNKQFDVYIFPRDNIIQIGSRSLDDEERLFWPLVGPLFRNFGESINFVTLRGGRGKEEMGLINEYCGESLNGMLLCDLEITAGGILGMQRVLPRLTTLELVYCWWKSETDAVEMFSLCSKLQDFRISSFLRSENLKFSGGVAFPDLRSFSFSNDYAVTIESVRDLLQSSPQLKEIAIKRCPRIGSKIFPAIVQYVPKIESISFKLDSADSIYSVAHVKCLSHLPALKKLKLDCIFGTISPVIAELVSANVPLESLQLINFRCERQLFIVIPGLQKLTKLEISHMDSHNNRQLSISDDILEMISRMSKLTHLEVRVDTLSQLTQIMQHAPKLRELKFPWWGEDATLDEVMYTEILYVVTSRRNDCHLQIECTNRRLTLDVPRELLEANADKLTIRI